MALNEREMGEAVARIEAAAFDQDGWAGALSLVARAGGGWVTQLIGISSSGALEFNFGTGVTADMLGEFQRLGGADPDVNPRLGGLRRKRPATSAPVRVMTDDDFLSETERSRNGFYQEFLCPNDFPFVVAAELPGGGDVRQAISVARSRSQGAAPADDVAAVAALGPHLVRALDLQRRLERQGAAIAAHALDMVSIPAFLCDAGRRVVALTRAAEVAARRGDFIGVTGGKLRATTPPSDVELQAAVARAMARRGFEGAGKLTAVVLRDALGRARVADVAPMPLHRYALRAGALVMVALRDDPQRPGGAELLAKAYSLTETESQVALALARGESPAEIAAVRGGTYQTVRSQIKTLHWKLGVESQAKLIRAVNLLTSGMVG